jgi:hypothetical protein
MKRHALMLTTSILLTATLAACTGTQKPDCWRATHTKTNKDCNSGGAGLHSPGTNIKSVKRDKKATPPSEEIPDLNNTTPDTPDVPEQEDPPANNEDPGQDIPDQDDNEDNPGQSNSNDIEGFDPSTGLYGPGT